MGLATILGFAGDLAAVVAADFAFVTTVDFVFGRDLLPSADFEVGFAFPKPLSFDKVLDLEADAGLSSKVAFEAALGFAAAFALLACVAGVRHARSPSQEGACFAAVCLGAVCMQRAVLHAPRVTLHASRCLHMTSGCRRPHCRQRRHL